MEQNQQQDQSFVRLAERTRDIIGDSKIGKMQKVQLLYLEKLLGNLLERHNGDPEAPSKEEIRGQYGLVFDILPDEYITAYAH